MTAAQHACLQQQLVLQTGSIPTGSTYTALLAIFNFQTLIYWYFTAAVAKYILDMA